MKKENFLIILICMSTISYIFCNFFILFKRDLIAGFTFDISNFLFPILYISSDLIQEVYGYEKSRLAAKITIGGQLIFAIFCFFTAQYFSINWLDEEGNKIIRDNILSSIASTITIATIVSYYLGDWVNDIIFAKLNNNKNTFIDYSKRSFISSLAQKLFDAILFNLILIFLPNSNFTFKLVLIPILLEIILEFALLPINHKVVMKIKGMVNGEEKINYE